MTPHRVQMSRKKGWRMPPNTVYVGRPSKWGNLWKVGLVACGCRSAGECQHNTFNRETAQEAVDEYRWHLERSAARSRPGLYAALPELRGKNLACWCRLDQPCHADVLLELANKDGAP